MGVAEAVIETLEVLPSPLKESVANAAFTSLCVPSKPISDLLSSAQLLGSELESAVYPQYPLICSSPETVVIFTKPAVALIVISTSVDKPVTDGVVPVSDSRTKSTTTR